MPKLDKTEEADLLIRALDCLTQPEGWLLVLDFLDTNLNCRSFLVEFDNDDEPTDRFGGRHSGRELAQILETIETAGGRNALQFLLTEAALYYPYCKTSLENAASTHPDTTEERLVHKHSTERSPLLSAEEEHLARLLSAPGLISPLWRSGSARVLLACLFTTHTPDTIDVGVANKTFQTIVQAITPALNTHYDLEKERATNQIQQILIASLDCPAILITEDRQILGHTPKSVDRFIQSGVIGTHGEKLVLRHKQVEAALQALQKKTPERSETGDEAEDRTAAIASAGETQSVCLAERDGSLIRISMDPVPVQLSTAGSAEACWYVIRLSETADLSDEIEGVLQDHYELSQSEARLARQLTLTGSMSSTAAALGITRNTAKTHLRRIYEKTGAHTQLQLASLVHKLSGLF